MASDKEKCADCDKPRVDYDIRGGICEGCFIDWWCEGVFTKDMDARERSAYRREVKRDIKTAVKKRRQEDKRERKKQKAG